jgi:hypothetical protein
MFESLAENRKLSPLRFVWSRGRIDVALGQALGTCQKQLPSRAALVIQVGNHLPAQARSSRVESGRVESRKMVVRATSGMATSLSLLFTKV